MDEILQRRVRAIFDSANFVVDLGMQLTGIEDGYCETVLIPAARHRQQHGLIHAGVLATMADHTSGCAARGAVGLDEDVISVEFKINFLRPAVADRLRCRGRVLRSGKTLVICEAEVFAEKDSQEKLVSKAMVTLAVKPSAVLSSSEPLSS
ncbi:MAG TPA: PaaI family thioesterase [Terriglobales bacterium]|jgi:uncharacterized protein (TIGR00369 family)|nr:PaaI family thioesterase [Terriglobales bacterium]